MIEWHVDASFPWWFIPVYLGVILIFILGVYAGIAFIDRWRQ